jgi:capsular polysaccharide biosynthesis protein
MEKEPAQLRNGAVSFPFIVFLLCSCEKKIQNATHDGRLKRSRRGPMWSTKGPKPIMLPLQIHSQSPGQNPPPTVQPWRGCWCPSPGRTPTPQATLILILKTEMAREEQGTSTSPHLVNPINQRKKENKKKRKRKRPRERENEKKNRDDTGIKTRKKIKRKERGREDRTGS